jgi:hypothetical protein
MTSGKTLEIAFDDATESTKGLLSAEDKKKLDDITSQLAWAEIN